MGQKPLVQTVARTPLASWRVRRELTQEQVAQQAGIPFSTYRRLERGGVAKPDVSLLTACARVLDCSLLDLLSDEQREWANADSDTSPSQPADAGPPTVSNKTSSAVSAAHSQPMGRAQGSANAAAAPRRPRGRIGDLSRSQLEVLSAAAIRGDFEPFLELAQTPGPRSDSLVDGDAMPAICQLAIDKARAANHDALEARVARAGVTNPAVRAGIVRAASNQAQHDLRVSLYRLVERQAAGGTLVASAAQMDEQAYALLDNRLSEALGEPLDGNLVVGQWRGLHS